MALTLSGDGAVGPLSATEIGYLDGVTSAVQTQINSKLNLAGGKILQIVRATDTTNRSTTSTSFVDASISVTITPQKNDSVILLMHLCRLNLNGVGQGVTCETQITDNSNNAISGAEAGRYGSFATGDTNQILETQGVIVAYSTPATTSATTYKIRFKAVFSDTITIVNSSNTGQLYAIEVSA